MKVNVKWKPACLLRNSLMIASKFTVSLAQTWGWTGSLTAVKAMPKGGEHIVNVSLQPFDIRKTWHDQWIAKISTLKSCLSIFPTSNRKNEADYTSQIRFSCDWSRKRLLLAVLKIPRKRQRNTGSHWEIMLKCSENYSGISKEEQ